MAEKESNPVGRPTVVTVEILEKLEEAFSIGATDREACLLANISLSALYYFQQENPEYAHRKEMLKDMPKYRARKNIVDAINKGDLDTSRWYNERKAKDEFSIRTETTGKDGSALISIQPSERLIELAEKLNNEHKPTLHIEGVSGSIGTATDTMGTAE